MRNFMSFLVVCLLSTTVQAEIIDGRNIDTTPKGGLISPREDVIVRTGQIDSRCLYSWDDSHQVHSEEIIVEWNYQKVKTTMKRLHHCIRLTVTGPLDVEGIAKSYVNKCVDYGMKKNSTRHALEAIVALGVDVLSAGATNGAATIAKLADYTKSVTDNTLDCLTDTDKVTSHVKQKITEKFNSTVTSESEWIYWDL